MCATVRCRGYVCVYWSAPGRASQRLTYPRITELLLAIEEQFSPAPCLLQGKEVGTSLSYRRVTRLVAWQRCPATVLDERTLLPRTDLNQCGKVCFRIHVLLEFIDADRCK